jgi:glycosyltransferase involved in cell wall biosynthesis
MADTESRPADAGKEIAGPRAPLIVAVMPAYRSAAQIGAVLSAMPRSVFRIVVVDDASPDDLERAVSAVSDPRIVLLRQPVNRGVGAAMRAGFTAAIELGADIVVKIDSDGQMDPARIADLVAPILRGEADFAKGNRFHDLRFIRAMPFVRRLGNLGLSFLVKAASGYWSVFDPCNGFLALRVSQLRTMRFEMLAERYFFEISLLCEAYSARAVLRDVPMPPRYADEQSSLSPARSLFEFLPRLVARLARRLGYTYFLHDFNLASVFLCAGGPLLSFGFFWSAYHWYRSYATGVVASSGTVIIGALTIILGFQLLLQAVVLDVQNEPGRRAH